MHLEILVEDSSGMELLGHLLPKILGPQSEPHSWRIHPYKGVGRLPKGLRSGTDAAKRVLLDQLPRLLGGYGKTPAIDAVVVVVDTDRRDCVAFLGELQETLAGISPAPRTLFRLAIEEVEAWLMGDRAAVLAAYPKASVAILDRYVQDSVCGTWETLADAVHRGGSRAIQEEGWPAAGNAKHAWAAAIGPLMDVEGNVSPSFAKLRDGLRRLANETQG